MVGGNIKTIEWFRNLFRRGGREMTVNQLDRITDHPLIDIDDAEYKRIDKNLRMYKGNWDPIQYVTSNGEVKTRRYMTLNMHKYVSGTLADLCWNDQCKIKIDNIEANAFVNQVLKDSRFTINFGKYLEPMFALGGLAVRPYYDSDKGRICFSWVDATTFYPLKSSTETVDECAIASKVTRVEGGKTYYYTLLEFHLLENENKIVRNELYRSDNEEIVGERVDVTHIDENLVNEIILTDLSRPLFSYLRPSGFNNLNLRSPLGISILDNSHNTVIQINDAYDQFNWEIKMGQRKIAVSDHFMSNTYDETNKRPQTKFDEDSNVFLKLRTDSDDLLVQDLTHDIRADQYVASINQLLKTLEMEIKLSPGTFSYDGRSMMTATEIVSQNSLSFRTRSIHLKEIEMFLKDLIVTICELGSFHNLYNGLIPTLDEISIDFEDGVFSSRDTKLNFYSQAATFDLIPRREAIQRVFGVSEDMASEWLHQMRMEQIHGDSQARMAMASAAMFGEDEFAGATTMRIMATQQVTGDE